MQPTGRPSFGTGPAGARGNIFYASTPPDAAVPATSQMMGIPPNPPLTAPLPEPSQLREDQLMQLQEPEYQEPHQGGHQQQQQQQKIGDKQQAQAPYVLDEQHSALLSSSYMDFLAPLRNNAFACEWVFGWALSNYASHDDATRLDLSQSRGFRSVHVCARRGCLSLGETTVLQTSSTLLLPVMNRDSVVVGYFMELAKDRETSSQCRTGKYVFFASSRELLKVSKVRGPANMAGLSSLCINRTSLVGHRGFIRDHVLASFSWQDCGGKVPERCIVHSRTLSWCKMIQTAEDAGFVGYGGVGDGVSLAGEATGEMRFLENSFHGLAPFGIFASTIVPSRLGFGAQVERNESPRFSIGNWAAPQHALVCNGIQVLHLGMDAGEIASMRSQFATAYGHVSAQLPRQALSSVNNRLSQNQAVSTERIVPPRQPVEVADSLNQSSVRSMELLSLSAENAVFGQKGIVPRDDAETLKVPKTAGLSGNVSSAVAFTPGAQRLDANLLMDEEGRRVQAAKKVAGVASRVPPYVTTSLVLPIQRPLALAGEQDFRSPVEEALKSAPSSVVESIEAAVAAQQVPSSSGDQIRAAAPVAAGTPQAVSFPTGPLSGAARGGEIKQQEMPTISPPTFKKTLPAPTKNEIIIRNRISAQRSNEKRRQKIEATKNELAYLRTTYLPQLQHRRGTLQSENQNLRLKYMQKYQQRELESFF